LPTIDESIVNKMLDRTLVRTLNCRHWILVLVLAFLLPHWDLGCWVVG